MGLIVHFADSKVNIDGERVINSTNKTHACDSAIVVQSFGKSLWML